MVRAIGVACVGLLVSGGLAAAQDGRCRVTDPTDTPLNVRLSPNGAIVGTLDNGRPVFVIDRGSDQHGKPWVRIGDSDTGVPIGWVFREFISCY